MKIRFIPTREETFHFYNDLRERFKRKGWDPGPLPPERVERLTEILSGPVKDFQTELDGMERPVLPLSST